MIEIGHAYFTRLLWNRTESEASVRLYNSCFSRILLINDFKIYRRKLYTQSKICHLGVVQQRTRYRLLFTTIVPGRYRGRCRKVRAGVEGEQSSGSIRSRAEERGLSHQKDCHAWRQTSERI